MEWTVHSDTIGYAFPFHISRSAKEFKARDQITAGFESVLSWWPTVNKNVAGLIILPNNRQICKLTIPPTHPQATPTIQSERVCKLTQTKMATATESKVS
ncbi:hypothetical protein QTO34_000250 [Cnephaeus nilssonii]|uniref:Uncharacterized protein n=1 Tax=Cnephaeus nilssonii TaxID=3371016 RepID=A0AA40LWQ5_CNENI|nr:hypothetical protein QTO34_000250 [Eptesicus nilssonii]